MYVQPEGSPSTHEILARKFEQWQKEYYDDVNAAFLRQDRVSGEVAFDAWEQRFITFLEWETPSLASIYERQIKRNLLRYSVFGASIYESWKASKGEKIEAILTQAIKDARAGRLVSEATQFNLTSASTDISAANKKIFIGHGNSKTWKDLKEFIQDRLKLQWDEFNREPTAGIATTERLEIMLKEAGFAFLVLTAEDEHLDGTIHARENVVHESGLFQGRLGFRKAIILLEEGCEEFSNIKGLTQIRFPIGNIPAVFEEIRRVLEREGIL